MRAGRLPVVVAIAVFCLSACTQAPTVSGPTPDGGSGVPAWNGDKEVVLVVGDFGSGSQAEIDVAAAMEKVAVDRDAGWFMTVGDNFYSDDIDLIWNQPFGWVEERGLQIVGALGNHDVESEQRRELNREVLGIDDPWRQLAIGGASVVVLDSNQVADSEQSRFIDGVLPPSSDGMVVTAFHHPPYSCSLHGDTAEIADRWIPDFEAGGVDLVLSGHDHNYQRLQRREITYVVAGGGGQRLYQPEPCREGEDPAVASEYEHNSFVVLTIGTKAIEGEAITSNGDVIDTFSVP